MSHEYIEPSDRKSLAIQLRIGGYHIDYEDWDGLSDDQVHSRIGKLVTRLEGENNEV